MAENLLIACVGDQSLHDHWLSIDQNYDVVILYYGDNNLTFNKYSKNTSFCIKVKGEKFPNLDKYINDNLDFIKQYKYIWLPDDDIRINPEEINLLFSIAKKFNLSLCQPAMEGYISHAITSPERKCLLRFTNFVEILAPLMSIDALLTLKSSFSTNQSGWGLDMVLWPMMLGYPENKIAIVDAVVMTHTQPVGTNYSRFKVSPREELKVIIDRHLGSFPKLFSYSSVLSST